MPLAIETIGIEAVGAPVFRRMNFSVNAEGAIEQRIADGDESGQDGRLRAIVPPEGWEGLAAQYPQVQPLIDQLQEPKKKAKA